MQRFSTQEITFYGIVALIVAVFFVFNITAPAGAGFLRFANAYGAVTLATVLGCHVRLESQGPDATELARKRSYGVCSGLLATWLLLILWALGATSFFTYLLVVCVAAASVFFSRRS